MITDIVSSHKVVNKNIPGQNDGIYEQPLTFDPYRENGTTQSPQ